MLPSVILSEGQEKVLIFILIIVHFCLHICGFRVFFLERWKVMHLLGLVRQCTQYCGIQISSVGCFVHPHQARRTSCKFLDPDACYCHFLTPCQVYCDHMTAFLCAITSIKWKLRPTRLIVKCSDHICCLNSQCSKIFTSVTKCMHRSVFVQVLRNSNRKGSNFYFSQAILPYHRDHEPMQFLWNASAANRIEFFVSASW